MSIENFGFAPRSWDGAIRKARARIRELETAVDAFEGAG